MQVCEVVKSMTGPRCFILVMLFISATAELRSQLFEEEYPPLEDYRTIGFGLAAQNFTPSGGNTLPDSARIRIATPVWLAEYRQMGLRVSFGYSSYKFDNDRRSELSFAAESITNISFRASSERGEFYLPVVFSTSFIEASGASNSTKDFNIANVGIGTGITYKHVAENFGVQFTGVGIIYYSTASFSVESGSSSAAVAELQFLFRKLIGDGVSAGYRFETQAWSMSDKSQNYVRLIQGPFIGIFF